MQGMKLGSKANSVKEVLGSKKGMIAALHYVDAKSRLKDVFGEVAHHIHNKRQNYVLGRCQRLRARSQITRHHTFHQQLVRRHASTQLGGNGRREATMMVKATRHGLPLLFFLAAALSYVVEARLSGRALTMIDIAHVLKQSERESTVPCPT
jgi:hypothetical protein